jgi:hypothetical protein
MTRSRSSNSKFAIPALLIVALSVGGHLSLATTQNAESASAAFAAQQRDGSHDFDFLIGDWKAHVRRLPDRLNGSDTWDVYDGIFHGNRGEFFHQETLRSRVILVRYMWLNISPKAARMEQSFSPDGGKTWEVNWICELSR